jgi:methylmalonyl-CoA mutase cobalamin-binding domain/chain
MSQLYPYIFNHGESGKIFIGTCVGNELHEIGIRMITDFYEMAGWDTYFIGSNTPAETVVETVIKQNADVLGVSCTISYHIRHVRELLTRLRNHGSGAGVKVIVGGYPFNKDPSLWKTVGADNYATDAESAVEAGEALIS